MPHVQPNHNCLEISTQSVLGGHLYVVATPIGHLGDISPRALHILKNCDYIACEDTRVTRKLLDYFNFNKQLISYRDENEKQKSVDLLNMLQAGNSIAIVSDAGTPVVSDPGFRLTRLCRKEGIPIVAIPGPCALITALSASGLPSNAFFFSGFLPPKKSARIRFFEEYINFKHTIIVYESCHRILSFLEDAITVFGEKRVICLAREITKKFETFLVGGILEVNEKLKKQSQKGEFVVLIAPEDFNL